jgi:hypothetical protein
MFDEKVIELERCKEKSLAQRKEFTRFVNTNFSNQNVDRNSFA